MDHQDAKMNSNEIAAEKDREESETDRKMDLLTIFLSDRDSPCPVCGYNLRGVESTICPECGRGIALSIHETGGLAGCRGLLAMIFIFLILTAFVNGIRTGVSINLSVNTTSGYTIMPGSGTGSITAPTLTWTYTNLQEPSWSNVTWRQWTAAVWWTVLALVASIAIVLVIRSRKRSTSYAINRVLMLTAYLGLTGCAAYFIVAFAGW